MVHALPTYIRGIYLAPRKRVKTKPIKVRKRERENAGCMRPINTPEVNAVMMVIKPGRDPDKGQPGRRRRMGKGRSSHAMLMTWPPRKCKIKKNDSLPNKTKAPSSLSLDARDLKRD